MGKKVFIQLNHPNCLQSMLKICWVIKIKLTYSCFNTKEMRRTSKALILHPCKSMGPFNTVIGPKVNFFSIKVSYYGMAKASRGDNLHYTALYKDTLQHDTQCLWLHSMKPTGVPCTSIQALCTWLSFVHKAQLWVVFLLRIIILQ